MGDGEFISHDFKLPIHSNELSKADEVIEKLRSKFKKIQKHKSINDTIHTNLYEEIVRILDYVGGLSMSIFAIEEEMENLYVLQYPKSPKLSKKLFNDHYEKLHHPYTLLKNRCFRLLEELDNEYIKRLRRKPPNWKI
jgi:hypothetical protein